MKNITRNRILVILGPNMNLISQKLINDERRTTIDKINKCLRKEAKKFNYQLKIIQTNNESVAVMALQRQRNKISGSIIFPGPWQKSGHVLKDTLEIIQIPYITVSTGEIVDILSGIDNIANTDILTGCKEAIAGLISSI